MCTRCETQGGLVVESSVLEFEYYSLAVWLEFPSDYCIFARRQLPGRALSILEDIKNPASFRVRYGSKNNVASGTALPCHAAYFHLSAGGAWYIENMLPSGSENVATMPQGTSSGCGCVNSTPRDFSSVKAFLQSETRRTIGSLFAPCEFPACSMSAISIS